MRQIKKRLYIDKKRQNLGTVLKVIFLRFSFLRFYYVTT